MSVEQNKQIVRQLMAAFDTGDYDGLVGSIVHPEAAIYLASPERHSVEEWLEGEKMFFQAFPDIRMTVQEQVAEGDRVATRLRVRGTHEGELMGMAPTGKEIDMTTILWSRIDDGQIVEHQEEYNMMTLMRQLGVEGMMEEG